MRTTTTKPKLIDEPAKLYHQKAGDHLSSTNLSRFRRCPQIYYQHRCGLMSEPERDAYAFGEAFHCLVLEPERFEQDYLIADGPINERTGKPYGTETKAYRSWASAQTRPVVSVDNYAAMCSMSSAIQRHERAGILLKDAGHGHAEKVLRAELHGKPCQIRCDWLDLEVGLIVDLKTTKSLGTFQSSAIAFSYIHQLAFYRDVANAAGADVDTVAIVAVEKSEPYRCGLFCPSDKSIEQASDENAAAIAELLECERSNVWPTRFAEPILLELE